MNRLFKRIRSFFLPPEGTPLWLRLAPYIFLGILSILALWGGAYGWEYTNSPEFCGTACHTMPPEYTSYLDSPHARVACVDCHIGQGFITQRITRKAGDAKHIIAAVFKTYEYPKISETLGKVKMTVTQINAGHQHNVIPASCKFVVDVRVTDAYSNEEVFEIIKANVRRFWEEWRMEFWNDGMMECLEINPKSKAQNSKQY